MLCFHAVSASISSARYDWCCGQCSFNPCTLHSVGRPVRCAGHGAELPAGTAACLVWRCHVSAAQVQRLMTAEASPLPCREIPDGRQWEQHGFLLVDAPEHVRAMEAERSDKKTTEGLQRANCKLCIQVGMCASPRRLSFCAVGRAVEAKWVPCCKCISGAGACVNATCPHAPRVHVHVHA